MLFRHWSYVSVFSAISAAWTLPNPTPSSLIVDKAPNETRPYVLLKNTGEALALGANILRFLVTGNVSEQSFAMVSQSSPDSSLLAVSPHIHRRTYENFFVNKGRIQLWAWQNETGGLEFSRLMTAGDYAVVPHHTLHTYQFLEPDTQLTFVVQPGGFENLFYVLAEGPFKSSSLTPFYPQRFNDPAGAGDNAEVLSQLEKYDVYFQPQYNPTRKVTDGMAGPPGYNWHNGSNELAPDSQSTGFVAKDWSSKYLYTKGSYQIVQPLATPKQTDGNITMGTITLSKRFPNETIPVFKLPVHTSFQMTEGQAIFDVYGYEALPLVEGDTAFIPANTSFSYYATSPMTRFMYVSGGGNGLDAELLRDAVEWEFASYPVQLGYGSGH
ncbi:hypothetical protein ACHAPA_010851 [Fusarium lateritium]